MNIISASRRTDIPAFHAEWVVSRFRERSVQVVNPFNRKVREQSLSPDDVAAIVFWTKNAEPIARHLDEISDMGHDFTFLYSINNYPSIVELNVPKMSQTIRTLEKLAESYGSKVFRWRYDTIILTESLNRSWHMKNFSNLCGIMGSFVDECIFSFCDYYGKTKRNLEKLLPDHREPDCEESVAIALELAEIAADSGIKLLSCAHDFLAVGPIGRARCIDPDFLKQIVRSDHRKLFLDETPARPTRKDCGCVASVDIGSYNTCFHGCAYCYATGNARAGLRNPSKIS
ncbi:MAG: DUF1848 domain-containing protein [Pseudomonadota bacterium]